MGVSASIAKILARRAVSKIKKEADNALQHQQRVFKKLLSVGRNTLFGKDHSFDKIHSYENFVERVPIRNYEAIKPYVERVIAGEENVLWKGIPLYLCKTSGTTSGVKYIPLTKESIGNNIKTARNALFSYAVASNNYRFFDGKMIFLSGSPELDFSKKIPVGRLSGIVNHHVPAFFRRKPITFI